MRKELLLLAIVSVAQRSVQIGDVCDSLDEYDIDTPVDLLANEIRVGAFNIQKFGDTKAANGPIMDILMQIVNRYDLVLIQEVLKKDAITKLVNKCNEERMKNDKEMGIFELALSDKLPKNGYGEFYAFLYNKDKLSFEKGLHWDDVRFARPPFITKWKVGDQVFAFIPLHSKPTNAVEEINALYDVYTNISKKWSLHDILIGGDLNADCAYVKNDDWKNIRLRKDTSFDWVIGDYDNTRVKETRKCAYDRLVLSGEHLKKWYSASGTPASTFMFQMIYCKDIKEGGQSGSMESYIADRGTSDRYMLAINISLNGNEEFKSAESKRSCPSGTDPTISQNLRLLNALYKHCGSYEYLNTE